MADMKTIQVNHGKAYAEVGERVKAFKEKDGDSGSIITTIIQNDEQKDVSMPQ